jgi:hypothetical protein
MDMQPVESSNIKAVGYDQPNGTLRVQFLSGATHDYPDVSSAEYASFLAADSKGKHFHRHIRSRKSKQVA